MKMMALVLIGVFVGLGLIILPTFGTASFFPFGTAIQYSAGENKNTSGTAVIDGTTIQPAAADGNSVYRSISESPVGPYGVPAVILALGVAVAVGAYLIIRRSVP
jgi:hypothetical protein